KRKHGTEDKHYQISLAEAAESQHRIDAKNQRERTAREPVPLRKETGEEQDAQRERDHEQEVALVREVGEERVEEIGLHDREIHEHDVISRRDADEQVLTEFVGGIVLVEEAVDPEREERRDPDPDIVAQVHATIASPRASAAGARPGCRGGS